MPEENPGLRSVSELTKNVDKGNYVIPYFQRGYEWNPGLVCDLFESILQEYYTGLLLFWELDDKQTQNEEWEPVWGSKSAENPDKAVLDGQQRLSSLYYTIYNPKEKFPNRKSYYKFTMDLDKILNGNFEGAVNYTYSRNYREFKNSEEEKEKWLETGKVPLDILTADSPENPHQNYMDSNKFKEWIDSYLNNRKNGVEETQIPEEITSFDVYQIFKGILDYQFVIYPLSNDRDVADIANIFARVNQKGMRLSTFDLMNAFLYPKGINLRKELWEELENEKLKKIDKKMNEYLLKLISLYKQDYCSSSYIYNLTPEKEVEVKDSEGKRKTKVIVKTSGYFEDLWDKACHFSEEARKIIMNTGDSEFGAIKTDFIPNSTIVPVLGAILWKNENLENGLDDNLFKDKLSKWYWSSVLSGDYSGSSNSVMSKDFREWSKFVQGEEENIERVEKIDEDFIENELDLLDVEKGSAQYKAVISLLALNGAEDFFKGRIIGTGDYSKEKINDHHIFPKKVKDLDPQKSKKFEEYKDSILNRTLLLDETNKRIKNDKPSEYLENISERINNDENILKERMKSHFISERALKHLREDNFDKFVKEREKRIKKEIKEKLDIP